MPTTTTRPRTKAVLRDGRPTYVGGGAVTQDGSLKLYRCTGCGDEVVWATSARTGRRYLANVHQGFSGARFYVKNNAHDCGARQAEQAKAQAVEQARRAYMDALHAFQATPLAQLTTEQRDTGMAELDRLADLVTEAEAL